MESESPVKPSAAAITQSAAGRHSLVAVEAAASATS
jgi:hypothetical protein